MWYNKTIYELFSNDHGFPKQPGEIGLELELEGTHLPINALQYYWNTHRDGSLRPVDGHPPCEYMLKKPVKRDDVIKVINYLNKKLADAGAEPQFSQRTSVHVHINVQELTFQQVMTMLTLFYVFEEVLTEYAGGKLRQGNLFCLKAKDAEHILVRLVEVIKNGHINNLFDPDRLKYHSCNVSSLANFGSLEFRAHRGCNEARIISDWVNVLLCLKDKSLLYKNPQDVVQQFSIQGLDRFVRGIFGVYADDLMNTEGSRQKVWDGLRLSQDIAYAIPEWKTDEVTKDKSREDYLIIDDPDHQINAIMPDPRMPAARIQIQRHDPLALLGINQNRQVDMVEWNRMMQQVIPRNNGPVRAPVVQRVPGPNGEIR